LEITMNASAQAQQSNHFNLHVNGVGYLNRVRWVEVNSAGRKAQPFLACSISALRGNAEQPDYTYFDLRVSGSEAIEMVEQLKVNVDGKQKVVVSFRVGDIYPHVYLRDVRDRDGRKTGEREPAAIIKGRLLLITSITIDGENVYRRDPAIQTAEAAASPDDDQEEQLGTQPQHQEPEPRTAPAPLHSKEQQGQQGRERQQAPGAPQNRPVQQQSRPMPALRQQQGQRDSHAYQAGHTVGRAARFVRDQVAA
jgi:hypothetical protein